jgi:hypothetical protein
MTRARIVALTLIGLVVLALAYLKVGAAEDPVSVPAGALAGYGLPQRVDDLEAARVALGYERIDPAARRQLEVSQ